MQQCAAGASSGRADLSARLLPPETLQLPLTLAVTVAPTARPVPGSARLAETLHRAAQSFRQTLPAGFGSGWDNFRGHTRVPTARKSARGHHATAGKDSAHSAEDEALRQSLARKPGAACELPNWHHHRQSSGDAAALLNRSCSVVAFSPDGQLLAVAAEGKGRAWSVEVCSQATVAAEKPWACCVLGLVCFGRAVFWASCVLGLLCCGRHRLKLLLRSYRCVFLIKTLRCKRPLATAVVATPSRASWPLGRAGLRHHRGQLSAVFDTPLGTQRPRRFG